VDLEVGVQSVFAAMMVDCCLLDMGCGWALIRRFSKWGDARYVKDAYL
jgi:hypothetical protein